MDVQYKPVKALMFKLGVSYLDTRFIDASGKLATSCPPDEEFDDSSLACDSMFDVLFLHGVRRPNAPEWEANLAAKYRFKLGKYRAAFGLYYKWTAEKSRVLNHDKARSIDAHDVLNISFDMSKNRYSLSVYVKNVLDDRIIHGRERLPLKFGGGTVESLNRYYKRTFGMTVTTKF